MLDSMGHSPSSPSPAPATDVALSVLLDQLGYGGGNEAAARQVLQAAGLTRAGKQRIAARKRDDVARVLRDHFVLSCARPGCQEYARATGRAPLPAGKQADCEHCGGSDNRQAVARLCAALRARGLQRLVVVGGSPAARENLSALIDPQVQLRLVDGVARRTKTEAQADLRWADRIVIWGSTQLDHKVSSLYTDAGDERVLVVHRRGIAALAEELLARVTQGAALAQRGR